MFVHHYGKTSVSLFAPTSLQFLQMKFVAAGYARKTVNRYVDVIKQMFKRGVADGLVEPTVLTAIQAVENLKAGRTTAREYRKIKSVDEDTVEKTLPFLPPVVRDMVRVQMFGGMRPQDVRNMRSCDIDRSGEIWRYTPFTHKTEHEDKIRYIALGPRAQAVLASYLIEKEGEPEAFLFSPKDSVRLQTIEKRQKRKCKVYDKQEKRRLAKRKGRNDGDQYTKSAYERAILRACKLAGVKWTANQLRHTAGQKARDIAGLEGAQAFLGHANAKTTEIYAEAEFAKAAEIAEQIG
jgi:integrase